MLAETPHACLLFHLVALRRKWRRHVCDGILGCLVSDDRVMYYVASREKRLLSAERWNEWRWGTLRWHDRSRGCCLVVAASNRKRKEEARSLRSSRVHAQARSRKCWLLHAACLWCRRPDLPCEDSHFATSLVCLYHSTGDDTPSILMR